MVLSSSSSSSSGPRTAPETSIQDIGWPSGFGFQARAGWLSSEGGEDCPSADLPLRTRIRAIHAGSRGTYGTPRVTRQLRRQGLTVNRALNA